ncbi:hypothetical protein Q8F55_009220 [Vanrija albida]|uniref:Uncharacterized protein n=1 Tax=Vanrija albida TaxID=181172 RepID=A0ABR3PT16_9TREE
MIPLDTHPHLLDRVLSHAPWSALPALRATSHTTAAFADAVLCAHVVVTLRGRALALLDPFRMARIPGLRFDPQHADYAATLRRLAAHTHTFDFVSLGGARGWADLKRIAETRRIRAAEAITYLLDAPEDVVLFHTVDLKPRDRRELKSTPFKRLVLRLDISQAHTTQFASGPQALGPMTNFAANSGYLYRARELAVLFSQGSGRPVGWWREVMDAPNEHPVRPLDILLSTAFCPLISHDVTFAGLEAMDPRILFVAPTEPQTSRLARLREALRVPMARGADMFRERDGSAARNPGRVGFELVSLDEYRRASGLDDYEWRLVMTKPGVKLPFPRTWNVHRSHRTS